MDDFGMGLSSLAELNYMRLEAMDLFERCLTEGKPDSLIAFIERQIAQDPPRVELLREVADDLHQRLIGLHDYYLDTWERTLTTLDSDFDLKFDLKFASAPFKRFEVDTVIRQLQKTNPHFNTQDETTLRKTLGQSIDTAAQLRADIGMTERLYVYICDWVDGLNATIARRYWAEGRSDEFAGGVH
ncbi:MAG: hypothetical protein CL610_04355 [Anaerolineaceae bacterium]|nr:hypothetical protein [Anaerolineaceae bacterium]